MKTKSFLHQIERRDFLKIVSLTGLSGLIYPSHLIGSVLNNPISRVVVVEDDEATSGFTINTDKVQVMMDAGIMGLAINSDIGEAWKSMLPGITSSSVIALKVNCVVSTMPTHPEVTNAVINGLTKMSFFNGSLFPENNIIIFDRSNGELQAGGYTLNTGGFGVRCFGNNDPNAGYSSESYSVNGVNQKLSRIVTSLADYIINISVLKNHGVAGVTLCLKNHYGTCNAAYSIHGNHCDPYIPALNALDPIKEKQEINIIDALYGIYTGGPSGNPQFIANKIIMSKDIVATDYVGTELLKDNNCTTTGNAHHISTAAQDPYNLGTDDPSQMDILNITNPITGLDNENNLSGGGFELKQNYPNPFGGHTQIDFFVPEKSDVRFTIMTNEGRKVQDIVNGTMEHGWHTISWNGKDGNGFPMSKGFYIGQLVGKNYKKSIIMQLVK